MDVPTDLHEGDIITLDCKPGWFPPSLLCTGIQSFQRWLAQVEWLHRRGYPGPHWRRSHVGRCLRGKVFEVTFPRARWTPVEEFCHGHWRQMRRQVDGKDFDFPEQAVDYMVEAANKLMTAHGGFYDVGQLFDFVTNALYGVPSDQWKRRWDFSKKWHVCSAGAAYVEEYARRKLTVTPGGNVIPNIIPLGLMAKNNLAIEPWPRAFSLGDGRYLHTERVPPAAFSCHPDYRMVAEGPK